MEKERKFSAFDQLDYRICQLLREDARMSAAEVARRLDERPRTVRHRIERLIAQGGGRAFWVFEPKTFGYVISVDIFLEIDVDQASAIYQQILSYPSISYFAYGHGRESVSIEGLFKTPAEMDEFIHVTLPAIPGVRVKSHALVPKVIRNLYEWEPAQDDF